MLMHELLYNKTNTLTLEKKLEKQGISSLLLMMRAGHEIYQFVKEKFEYDKIIAIAGPGNNGGDAIAFSIQAKLNNENIVCLSLANLKGNSKKLADLSKDIGLKIKTLNLACLNTKKKTIIIDGILGIGISRKPVGLVAEAIRNLNHQKKNIVVSIDIPSGLNPDNAVSYPDTICANYTFMCLTKKQACYTGDGIKFAGKLYFSDLGIRETGKIQKPSSHLINCRHKVKLKRKKHYYKGKYGSILVLGGWDNMPGAAYLSALAALKTGCGKVYMCTNNFQKCPYEIIRVMPDEKDILNILDKIDVIVAGPGLSKKGNEILKLLWKTNKPLVLDADGLNWLAKNFANKRKSPLIGTPHHGEAVNLLGKAFNDRFYAVKKIKQKYGGTWVLKGPGTIILDDKIYINDFADSILATAGSGDVLAGIIGGLIAQKEKNPVIKAVQIHSHSAYSLMLKRNTTVLASELIKKISTSIDAYK